MGESQALTKICIVSSAEFRGEGSMLTQTNRGFDADLFESTWRHKGKRFLCIARDSETPRVITEISIIKDDEPVPPGFSGIFLTDDTKEKALRKHVVCMKSELRMSAKSAVTDVVLIHTGKRESPPAGYLTTNEVNDIRVAYRIADLTKITQNAGMAVTAAREVPVHAADTPSNMGNSVPKSPVSGLDGIPFQINPKFDVKAMSNDPILSGLRLLTLNDIDDKFNYDFSTEESVSRVS